jgi:hypothetical protein
MVYKMKDGDKWIRVPVDGTELDLLKKILKREKKTLKNFVDEQIRNYLTRKTLIV